MTNLFGRALIILGSLVLPTIADAQKPNKVRQIVFLTTSAESLHGIYVEELRRALRDEYSRFAQFVI